MFFGSWQTMGAQVHVDSPYGSCVSEPIGHSNAQLLAKLMFRQIVRGQITRLSQLRPSAPATDLTHADGAGGEPS